MSQVAESPATVPSSNAVSGDGATKRKASGDAEEFVGGEDALPSPRITRARATALSFVKTENLEQGNVQCPECHTVICVSERGCNVITCRNHQPTFLYFCAHCKQVSKDAEYSTCSCPKRNTLATRAQVLKQKNERNRELPIELLDDSYDDSDQDERKLPDSEERKGDMAILDDARKKAVSTTGENEKKSPADSTEVTSIPTEVTMEWLSRLEKFLVAQQSISPKAVSLVVATKDEMKRNLAKNSFIELFLNPGLIILSNKDKPKRINRYGEVYYHGLHPGTEGDAMWLLNIETGEGSMYDPIRKFTDPPVIKGDLHVCPCNSNEWYMQYNWQGGQLIQDIQELGSLPGPFDGPTLAPIIDKIKVIVKKHC